MTIMFCFFDETALILRLYGNANIYPESDQEYIKLKKLFKNFTETRQIIEMDINQVQTSCGYGVPFMVYQQERTQLNE